jgi:heme/copper-type cytochrome/quinol oxidase subunit 2
MRKIVAIFTVVTTVIIIGAIAYTSIDWQSDTDKVTQADKEVPLKNEGTIQLTAQEYELKANLNEKKVILTDLGMY